MKQARIPGRKAIQTPYPALPRSGWVPTISRVFRVLFIGDVVGRPGRTYLAAHLPGLRKELEVDLVTLQLDKDKPLEAPVKLSLELDALRDRTVVLVDDVLMSGRTLMHAAAHLVTVPLKRLTTVVLVDRRHRSYPIRADIVGLTLSTTTAVATAQAAGGRLPSARAARRISFLES